MSPKSIENRLKLVGELTKACLLIRQNTFGKIKRESETNNFKDFSRVYKNKIDNKIE